MWAWSTWLCVRRSAPPRHIIAPEPSKCFLELLRAAAAAAVAGNGTGEEMTLRPALILRACMTPLVSVWWGKMSPYWASVEWFSIVSVELICSAFWWLFDSCGTHKVQDIISIKRWKSRKLKQEKSNWNIGFLQLLQDGMYCSPLP